MLNALATQDEVTAFKQELELLAANLSFHVNSPLDKAHGITLFHGFIDAGGNDLRLWRDSTGRIISGSDVTKPNMIRWIIGGVPYYTPNLLTDPGAQPPGTGSITVTPVVTDGPQSASLITDYVTDETQSAINANSLFLEHTKLAHEDAHIGITVVNTPVLSGFGSVVARSRVRLTWGGHQWDIPADTLIGGPPQTPNIQMNPSSFSASTSSGNAVVARTFTPTIVSGTRPITFSWEYWDNRAGIWVAMVLGVETFVPFQTHFPADVQSTFTSASTGALAFNQATSPGNGGTDFSKYRLTATNSSGSTHQDIHGNDLLFFVYISDNGGGCWFCTESEKTKRVKFEDWQTIGKIEQELFRCCRRMVTWYVRTGDTLVERMNAAGIKPEWYVEFTEGLLNLYWSKGMQEAMLHYVRTVSEMTIKHWPDCNHPGYRAGKEFLRLADLHPEEANVNVPIIIRQVS